jgi:FkbM family methyltransferase
MATGFDVGAGLRRWRKRRSRPTSATSPQEFLDAYFASPEEKCVIQVGANDGIMCDPLRPYLAPGKDRRIRAVLIEPIPLYFEKLKELYADYANISVINVACGQTAGSAPLYFIDPDVADQMNGAGPANNWAHGQGSFDQNVVKYWIGRNKFRGEDYVRNIDRFYTSIRSIEVEVIRVADVELSRSHRNLLLVIDVQGFELEVVRGIDWRYPPAYILVESDLMQTGPLDGYLGSKGYRCLCGQHDKVFAASRE